MVEIADIKIAVLQAACGIQALEEPELYRLLENFWVDAYKRGSLDTKEEVVRHLRETGFLRPPV